MTLEAAETLAKEKSRTGASHIPDQSGSNKSGLAAVGSGVGLVTVGLALFPLVSSLWPVFLIIPGMVLILAGLDDLAQTFRRPLYGISFWRLRSSTMSMRRESEREAAEEKKIESGEAD